MFTPMLYRLLDDPSEASPPPDTPAMAEAAAAVAMTERHHATLSRLAELGMALAEAIVAQTKEEGAAEAGAAFAKVGQAVRRAIALEQTLGSELGRRRGELAETRQARLAEARSKSWNARDEAIQREMKGVIEPETADDKDRAENLLDDIDELLTSEEFSDYDDRPAGETIARLCQALGLDPDWCVETPEGWAVKASSAPLCETGGSRLPPDRRRGLIDIDPKTLRSARSAKPKAPAKLE